MRIKVWLITHSLCEQESWPFSAELVCSPSLACTGAHSEGLVYPIVQTADKGVKLLVLIPGKILINHLSLTSQNHRIITVGRDLWISCCPTKLPRQDHLEQVICERIQVVLEVSREREIPLPPLETVPVLCFLQHKEVFPSVELKLFVFWFMVNASSHVTGHH